VSSELTEWPQVSDEFLGITMDARLEAHPDGQRARELRLQGPASLRQSIDMERAATMKILSSMDVVATTCVSAGWSAGWALQA
jgi:hypothetical protein